jgi:mannose-6-phosphate isomerase-like protein (cupin superfamily)
MAIIIPKEQLLNGNLFQGRAYGNLPISFFWVQATPGRGPRLHVHPYAEIFVVQEGHATFTLGESIFEVDAGNVVIGPAGMPHKFINSGEGVLRTINMHPSTAVIQEWLED